MNTFIRTQALRVVLALACFTSTSVAYAKRPTVAVAADTTAGIRFFKGTWSALLNEAKKQNKPIFVDVYTTWCGPCKLMAKEAFPDKAVGEKFNANFISYQIDAEKGEGIALAKQYAVDSYPTVLYVSATGDLVHRSTGYGNVKHFLDEADKAITAAKDPMPISVMDKQYAAGKRDADFLASYLTKLTHVGMPRPDVLTAYLDAVPESEWSTDKNLTVIGGNLTTATSKGFDVLLKNAPDVVMNPARRAVAQPLVNGLFSSLEKDYNLAVKQNDEALLNTMLANRKRMTTALPMQIGSREDPAETDRMYRMRFYQQTRNMGKYQAMVAEDTKRLMSIPADTLTAKDNAAYQLALKQTAAMPDSVKSNELFRKYVEGMKKAESRKVAMQLNNYAWACYDRKDATPAELKQALAWSGRSVELDRAPMFLDTYAHLLHRLGRKAEAITTEKEALDKAKTGGDDITVYEKVLTEWQTK
ncbi:thioredoxin family protein [Fibrella aquatilis]|uniref:Thioredoxin family protein n=1 Tax=Fibrella aquatilis TaxID=2817059 RepID=A0A939G8I6_9BACT|nr:thioredoxin fold domain-containing protein [Fibrella aquatilis]MBO0932031.1 thioredoxin family protein [Fibrella aquatilis]